MPGLATHPRLRKYWYVAYATGNPRTVAQYACQLSTSDRAWSAGTQTWVLADDGLRAGSKGRGAKPGRRASGSGSGPPRPSSCALAPTTTYRLLGGAPHGEAPEAVLHEEGLLQAELQVLGRLLVALPLCRGRRNARVSRGASKEGCRAARATNLGLGRCPRRGVGVRVGVRVGLLVVVLVVVLVVIFVVLVVVAPVLVGLLPSLLLPSLLLFSLLPSLLLFSLLPSLVPSLLPSFLPALLVLLLAVALGASRPLLLPLGLVLVALQLPVELLLRRRDR